MQYENFHNLYETIYFVIALFRFQNAKKLRDQIFGTVKIGRTEFSCLKIITIRFAMKIAELFRLHLMVFLVADTIY